MAPQDQYFWLLSAIVFLPALGAIAIAFVPGKLIDSIRWITLGFTVAVTALVFVVFFGLKDSAFDVAQANMQDVFNVPWIPSFEIRYFMGADGISMPLVVLTAVVSMLAMVASWSITKHVKAYCILFLLLETGMLGVFLALDFFLFYVFWEVMLLPMYFLIGVWGGPRKEYAALKFFLYTLVGSVLMLIAILMLYFNSDVRQLASKSDLYGDSSAAVTWENMHLGDDVKEQLLGENLVETWYVDNADSPIGISVIKPANDTDTPPISEEPPVEGDARNSTTGDAYPVSLLDDDTPPEPAEPEPTEPEPTEPETTETDAAPSPGDLPPGAPDGDAAGDEDSDNEDEDGAVDDEEPAKLRVLFIHASEDADDTTATYNAASNAIIVSIHPEHNTAAEVVLAINEGADSQVKALVKKDADPDATVGVSDPVHTFNLIALAGIGQHTNCFPRWLQVTAFILLFIGFAIKVPAVPVHTWLPDAHVEAPTPISMILAGVLLKMGGYGIIRICYPICPFGGYDLAFFVCLIGVISMVYGALAAMAQTDFKRLVAYSSVSHMGYVVLGLGVWSALAGTNFNGDYWNMGIKGAMFQMIGHGISSAGMFFMVGVIYDRVHHRNLAEFGGLFGKMPLYTALAIGIFFAGLGLPGLCGFIGEVFVVLSVWKFSWWMAVISAAVVVLTATYILVALKRVYLGVEYRGPHEEELKEINLRELTVAVPLFVLAILFGVMPHLCALQFMDSTIDRQVNDLTTWTKEVAVPADVAAEKAAEEESQAAQVQPNPADEAPQQAPGNEQAAIEQATAPDATVALASPPIP